MNLMSNRGADCNVYNFLAVLSNESDLPYGRIQKSNGEDLSLLASRVTASANPAEHH